MDLDTPGQAIDIEQGDCDMPAPPGLSVNDDANNQSAFGNAETLSSGFQATDTGDGQDPTSGTIHDVTKRMKKQLCLLFFRVAEVHKFPHSTNESIFNDSK